MDASELRGSSALKALPAGKEVESLGFVSRGDLDVSSEYTHSLTKKSAADEAKQQELLSAAAMAIAQAPGKNLFMTAFMLWMSGNSLQIFSIMMLGMAMWTPIGELANVNARFARFNDTRISLVLPKLTFVAIQLAALALGLYKCNSMGLLPTSTADWINPSVRPALHVAGGGLL